MKPQVSDGGENLSISSILLPQGQGAARPQYSTAVFNCIEPAFARCEREFIFVQLTLLIFRQLATKVKTSFTFARLVEKFAYSQLSTFLLLSFIQFQVVVFFTLSVPTESVQRALRMVAFLTQNVVDIFGVLWDFLSQPLTCERLTNGQTSAHLSQKR